MPGLTAPATNSAVCLRHSSPVDVGGPTCCSSAAFPRGLQQDLWTSVFSNFEGAAVIERFHATDAGDRDGQHHRGANDSNRTWIRTRLGNKRLTQLYCGRWAAELKRQHWKEAGFDPRESDPAPGTADRRVDQHNQHPAASSHPEQQLDWVGWRWPDDPVQVEDDLDAASRDLRSSPLGMLAYFATST